MVGPISSSTDGGRRPLVVNRGFPRLPHMPQRFPGSPTLPMPSWRLPSSTPPPGAAAPPWTRSYVLARPESLPSTSWAGAAMRLMVLPRPKEAAEHTRRHQFQRLPSFGVRTAEAAAASEGTPFFQSLPSCPSKDSLGRVSPLMDQLTGLTQGLSISEGSAGEFLEDKQTYRPSTPIKKGPMNREPFLNSVNGTIENAVRPEQKPNIPYCAFCKGNRELPSWYYGHVLNERKLDGSLKVVCPVLRNLCCKLCGAYGDNAHTISHCPINREPSVAVMLRNTRRRCDGSLRRFNKK